MTCLDEDRGVDSTSCIIKGYKEDAKICVSKIYQGVFGGEMFVHSGWSMLFFLVQAIEQIWEIIILVGIPLQIPMVDVMFLAIATVHSATIVQIALAQASLSLSVWPMNEAKANVDHTWPLLRFVNWCFAVLPLSTFLWKSVFQRLKCFNQNSHYFSEMYQSKSKELWLSIRPRTV